MLRPPLGNPGESPPKNSANSFFLIHAVLDSSLTSELDFLVPVAAGGRPAFTYQYHNQIGHGSLPGHNQIAGPLQTGTGQPRGHSGSSGVICDALFSIHSLFGLVLPP
jgi:hypothetical protein